MRDKVGGGFHRLPASDETPEISIYLVTGPRVSELAMHGSL